MSLLDRKIYQAADILAYYGQKYPQPFALYFAQQARQNKHWGSKDRKILKALCYATLRLGKHQVELPWVERIYLALPLVKEEDIPQRYQTAISEVLDKAEVPEVENSDYPYPEHELLSPLELAELLKPRKTWLRLRENKTQVRKVIEEADVMGRVVERVPSALGIPSGLTIDNIIPNTLKSSVQVQDISSQALRGLFQDLPERAHIWDACSGSGGKTLLLKDHYPKAHIVASDLRKKTGESFRHRLNEMGLSDIPHYVLDLISGDIPFKKESFDLIVIDAPCTGSGTWARNPEHLRFFDVDSIGDYVARQKELVKAVKPYLSKGGKLIYATCSVFRSENEGIFGYAEELGLTIESQHHFDYWSEGGDALFGAVMY